MPIRGGGGPGIPSAGSVTLTGDVTGTAAATVVSAISGASPIVITPAVLQWAAATATPTLTQAAIASTSAGSGAAGATMSVTAQAGQAATGASNNGGAGAALTLASGQGGASGSATNGNPGPINLSLPSALAGATQSLVAVQVGGTNAVQLGYSVGVTNAGSVYAIPNVAPTNSNYGLYQTTALTLLNAPASQTVAMAVGGTSQLSISSGVAGFRSAIGGLVGPLQFSGQTSPNTVACGTGGTQTISSAQAIIPFFIITSGTLASNAIIDFSTNAATGHFIVDLTGFNAATMAGFTLGWKNGTTTIAWTTTIITALRAAGKTAIVVDTFGTNNITLT